MGRDDRANAVIILSRARALMAEALQLLDSANALEPGAHLDLAIHALDAKLGHHPSSCNPS
ncbi:hypothetical protein NX02_12305 [Sphingomonas sanxanigenens DSM 19645 = NX02]|uniref:Uncharacterized protein n=1 Tax=Sphingomonas sanxanigenens DSM 19645 = NX02 TaxID=1123269 RepID=W0ACA5_9SPHN|nr:hypothetical protein NX02_12305 [Sphingomonas sanxanigenens DSM 19645 = NX02]